MIRSVIILVVVLCCIMSCTKENHVSEHDVRGYWKVQDPVYDNVKGDLFYLLEGGERFFKLSFNKGYDFKNLTGRARQDSLSGIYKVENEMLMITSAAYGIPGLLILDKTDSYIRTLRDVPLKRDLITGAVLQNRLDTVLLERVVDRDAILYFDNYLKIIK